MSMQPKNTLIDKKAMATRLINERKKHNLKQSELVELISEKSTRNIPYSSAYVSTWETGRRIPSDEVFDILSEIYDVPVNYLKGYIENSTVNETTNIPEKLIEYGHLYMMDGLPIYIVFPNTQHRSQWGIVNTAKEIIHLANGYLDFNSISKCKLYALEPHYNLSLQNQMAYEIKNFNDLINQKNPIYVKLKSSDPYITAKYNGWYTQNEDNTCLINKLGLTLPFEGLGVSYNAYINLI